MKGTIWVPFDYENSQKILPISNISLLSTTLDSCFALTESNDLYEIDLSSLSVTQLIVQISVYQIICNPAISMFIGSGQVFIYGTDSQKTGLLGPDTSNLKHPKKIEIPAVIIKGALSSHAAVIDVDGNIFTWGAGQSGQLGWTDQSSHEAKIIQNESFKASSVACGKHFTAVLTDGAFVHIFGNMGKGPVKKNAKGKIVPISVSQLEQFLALQVVAGDFFLCVLIEKGECFAFDSCLDLVKLPLPSGFCVHQIECNSESVYGLGDGGIIEWGSGTACDSKCEISMWTGRYYRLAEDYSQETQIFSNGGKHFSMIFQGEGRDNVIGSKFDLLKPYKRSNFAAKIEETLDQRFAKNRKSEDRVSCDLERLYSVGDNENIIKKIKKFRREHEFIRSLYIVLKGKTEKFIEIGFKALKDQAAMKKNYEKTLAAALIVSPIEKLLQRGLMTCCLFAVKSIFIYSEEVKLERAKKTELLQKRSQIIEEKTRDLFSVLCDKYFKELFNGFSLIKELEMRRLQKQTAVLSIVQVLFNHLKSSKKNTVKVLSQNVTKLKELKKTINKILNRLFRKTISSIHLALKAKLKRSNSINKSVNELLKRLSAKEFRKNLLAWKKQVENLKSSELKKKFSIQITVKSLNLVLSYALLKSYRIGFFSLKNLKKKDLVTPTFFLAKKLKLLVESTKKSTFRQIRVLINRSRSLALLFKTLAKAAKKQKRWVLKTLELNEIAFRKTTYLKSCIYLQFSLSKVLKARLSAIFLSFKSCLKPKVLLRKSPVKLAQNSVAFFDTEPDLSKSKYSKQKSCTSIDLFSPRPIFNSVSYSQTKTAELSVLEKTLIERKMLDQKNRVIKKSNKPPLKPPWKPTSTTATSGQKNPQVNTLVRRNDYSSNLIKKAKCHSKQSSSDLSNCFSSPTLSSRTSSRQKNFKKKGVSANWKFGFMILDNFRQNFKGKRMFESWCRIKYFCKVSQKTEAPRPLDVEKSWQRNLFRIGFESLKHLARKVIGRQIIYLIKS